MPRWSRTPGAAALVALLLASPASAATFTVSNGDDTGADTFRKAIEDANATPGADQIVFSGAILVTADNLPALTGPVSVDGEDSLLRGSNLVIGGGVVAVSRLGIEDPYGIHTDHPQPPSELGLRRWSNGVLHLRGVVPAPGAVELFAASGANFEQRFNLLASGIFEVPLASEPPAGQALTATLTTADGTSGFAPDFMAGDIISPVLTSGRTVDGNGDGFVDAIRLRTSEPLADAAGFGGLALAGLPVANAATGARPNDDEFDVVLARALPGDAAPAVKVATNPAVADGSGNQLLVGSEVKVADVVAPEPALALALSRTTVRLRFSEALNAALRAGDLELSMAGVKRTIDSVRMAPDRASLEVEARPSWPYASAGEIHVRVPLADALGNRSPADHPVVKVWAAPGDTIAPTLRDVKLNRRILCARGVSRNCRRSGGTVRFVLDEPATIAVDVRRARSTATSSLRIARNPGSGAVSFGDRVEGRRLRPGAYTLTVFAIDAAGNESPPTVIRVRVRR